jgi:diguanylate cyclase (GGDEF)-like protein
MGTVALGNVLDDVIDNLLASKLIHKDYETVWLDMWSELCAGTERVSREILVRYSKKRPYVWKRLVLQTIYKEKGVPLRAVGVLEDISLQKKIELAFIKERKYRKAMLAETLAFTEVNVSKNVVEKSTGVWERTKAHRRMSYDEILERVAKKRVYEEDREGYLSMLNRENLMNAYNSGRMELRCEHREIDFEGKLRWVKLTVYLVKDPISNDLKALAHLKDIDGRKTRELTMQYQSERDSLTGLYNKGTAEELTKDFLQKEAREDACHAFVILDLDDFKSLNDNHGHQFGDEVLKTTAQILKDIFRSDDIEGRLGGDEMVVLMKNIPDRQCVEERMGVLKERLQEISKDKTSVTASIGISLFGEHGNEYHELYRTADLALYRAKKQGRNQFVIYETNMGNEKE